MSKTTNSGRRRAVTDLDIPITLDRSSTLPLTRQLVAAVREAVLDGVLTAGGSLPSSRILARTLGVSRIVVTEAYALLISEGYLEGVLGSGTRVARVDTLEPGNRRRPETPHGASARPMAEPGPTPERAAPFQTGATSQDSGGVAAGLRAAARAALPTRYGDARGEPVVRAAVAGYLARSRGLVVDPDEVILTTGTTQSTDLVLRALTEQGDAAALEEPSHPSVHRLFLAHGLAPVFLPVDKEGARVSVLAKASPVPGVVHVTPSHQFPLGVRMSIARRSELVAWSIENDAMILEDDYDSEYRYDGPPLPALAGLARNNAIYLGTMSKVVSPALRCGYMVAPPDVASRITGLKDLVDGPLPWPMQQLLLHLIESGDLERHVRRMRLRYGRARAALQQELEAAADIVTLEGIETGLHVVVRLSPGLHAASVSTAARRKGLKVTDLAEYARTASTDTGIVIGYGAMDESEVRRSCRELVEILRMASRQEL